MHVRLASTAVYKLRQLALTRQLRLTEVRQELVWNSTGLEKKSTSVDSGPAGDVRFGLVLRCMCVTRPAPQQGQPRSIWTLCGALHIARGFRTDAFAAGRMGKPLRLAPVWQPLIRSLHRQFTESTNRFWSAGISSQTAGISSQSGEINTQSVDFTTVP